MRTLQAHGTHHRGGRQRPRRKGRGRGKAGVAKLNTDENQAIAVRFNINAIPTLLVFKDRVLVDALVGLRPKEDILSYVSGL